MSRRATKAEHPSLCACSLLSTPHPVPPSTSAATAHHRQLQLDKLLSATQLESDVIKARTILQLEIATAEHKDAQKEAASAREESVEALKKVDALVSELKEVAREADRLGKEANRRQAELMGKREAEREVRRQAEEVLESVQAGIESTRKRAEAHRKWVVQGIKVESSLVDTPGSNPVYIKKEVDIKVDEAEALQRSISTLRSDSQDVKPRSDTPSRSSPTSNDSDNEDSKPDKKRIRRSI